MNTTDEKCAFVIMPITVRESCLGLYEHSGGRDHFKHVYRCLLQPALEKAGYKATPPEFSGSINIQAEIIDHLSKADLVLCDMSAMNPNVFFELGARCALDRPAVLIVDEHHESIVPFDVNTIGFLKYSSRLESWTIGSEQERLAQHIANTTTKEEGNSLWRYFGIKSTGAWNSGTGSIDDKVNMVLRMLSGRADSAYFPQRTAQAAAYIAGSAERYEEWLNTLHRSGLIPLVDSKELLVTAAVAGLRTAAISELAQEIAALERETGERINPSTLIARLHSIAWTV